jgi:hypothetical protein
VPCFVSTYLPLSEKRQLVARLPLGKGPHGKLLPSARKVAFKYYLKQDNLPALTSYPRKPLGSQSFLMLARVLLIEGMKKFFSVSQLRWHTKEHNG